MAGGAGGPVGTQDRLEIIARPARNPLERAGDQCGDVEKADPAIEERGDRHLVGAAQHRGGAPPGAAGLEGQAQAREGVEIGGLERELTHRGPVDGTEGLRQPGEDPVVLELPAAKAR